MREKEREGGRGERERKSDGKIRYIYHKYDDLRERERERVREVK